MLMPLTQSLYVAGELATPDRVMLEVGTGYYIEVMRRH
jgi:prefoldin subunit 5